MFFDCFLISRIEKKFNEADIPRARGGTVTFSERDISPFDISHALLIVHSFLQRHPTNTGHINIVLWIKDGRKGD